MRKPCLHAFILLVCIGFSSCVNLPAQPPAETSVQTDSGAVRGIQTRANGIQAFLGIPYAAAPVGSLRWKPPQPVDPWDDVRLCAAFGSRCSQPAHSESRRKSTRPMSEDCLYLNIWTPAAGTNGKLPVMVWIHGGGFAVGSACQPIYNGEKLAAQGAVIVSINYRLGPFGFFAHPALSAESENDVSGNYGLLDMIAALKWVQQNIASFGGDPDNVTIFGESAGSMAVGCLMVSPLAEGLFHRAIAQSGSAAFLRQPLKALGPRGESAEDRGVRLAGQLTGDPMDLAALRQVDAQAILDTIKPVAISDRSGEKFHPIVDGYVLPDPPAEMFEARRYHDVPMMLGSNEKDGAIFAGKLPIKTPKAYEFTLKTMFEPEVADRLLEIFSPDGRGGVSAALTDFMTALAFACPARKTAQTISDQGGTAYLYQFTYVPELLKRRGRGAVHAMELPYVFGTIPPFMKRREQSDVSQAMREMWVRFAETGDPSGPDVRWPPYQTKADKYLEIGERLEVKSGLYSEACDLLEEAVKSGLGPDLYGG